MTWQLIDGVVAHDAFAAPTPPGAPALIEGLSQQQFAPGRSATAAPVDGVLGLSSWAAPASGELQALPTDAPGGPALHWEPARARDPRAPRPRTLRRRPRRDADLLLMNCL